MPISRRQSSSIPGQSLAELTGPRSLETYCAMRKSDDLGWVAEDILAGNPPGMWMVYLILAGAALAMLFW